MNNKPSTPLTANYEACQKIATDLLGRTQHRPTIGVLIGSSLTNLAAMIEEQNIFRYKDIQGFPIPTAQDYKGRLIFGKLCGKTVVCMQGRVHSYEGYHPIECALPIHVMKLLGVRTLVLTNSAGGLNGDYKVGDLMLVVDHVCLPAMMGLSPFVGQHYDPRFGGDRFPDMVNSYSSVYVESVKLSAARLNVGWRLRQGVYVMVAGPAYCTHAENRFLKLCGGDAVGMSNCWEVMAAANCGMKVLALCVITDTCKKRESGNSPDDVAGAIQLAVDDLTRLLVDTIPRL